ncbi:hypothetical protein PTSG_03800 [Salpingoeca rosetta]|uniref:Uncharacterized protein n=1 Tax=Salpingoeca rosetta (strain ATCC 50818 / BSB-021) TaxID=946362 RepID=F2U5F3_SALR5|nr:uncharacterized protein PTSG_03800 [Salpingoeca rosetta]EGD83169.1 hypothetical protein PTSG_03800 [Salpingoeca rosetta]|eukprot:XP_004995533.1 hypothetical protein PTSG_03800 [Salpingoeca rosetta]
MRTSATTTTARLASTASPAAAGTTAAEQRRQAELDRLKKYFASLEEVDLLEEIVPASPSPAPNQSKVVAEEDEGRSRDGRKKRGSTKHQPPRSRRRTGGSTKHHRTVTGTAADTQRTSNEDDDDNDDPDPAIDDPAGDGAGRRNGASKHDPEAASTHTPQAATGTPQRTAAITTRTTAARRKAALAAQRATFSVADHVHAVDIEHLFTGDEPPPPPSRLRSTHASTTAAAAAAAAAVPYASSKAATPSPSRPSSAVASQRTRRHRLPLSRSASRFSRRSSITRLNPIMLCDDEDGDDDACEDENENGANPNTDDEGGETGGMAGVDRTLSETGHNTAPDLQQSRKSLPRSRSQPLHSMHAHAADPMEPVLPSLLGSRLWGGHNTAASTVSSMACKTLKASTTAIAGAAATAATNVPAWVLAPRTHPYGGRRQRHRTTVPAARSRSRRLHTQSTRHTPANSSHSAEEADVQGARQPDDDDMSDASEDMAVFSSSSSSPSLATTAAEATAAARDCSGSVSHPSSSSSSSSPSHSAENERGVGGHASVPCALLSPHDGTDDDGDGDGDGGGARESSVQTKQRKRQGKRRGTTGTRKRNTRAKQAAGSSSSSSSWFRMRKGGDFLKQLQESFDSIEQEALEEGDVKLITVDRAPPSSTRDDVNTLTRTHPRIAAKYQAYAKAMTAAGIDPMPLSSFLTHPDHIRAALH